jgi:hypothetical protein
LQIAERGASPSNVTALNINMKINLKMAGANWSLAGNTAKLSSALAAAHPWSRFMGKTDERWMAIGVTVSNPQPRAVEAFGTPTVASVCASHNSEHSRFALASKCVQNINRLLFTFADILELRLIEYQKQGNKLPSDILVYRDQINEGDFIDTIPKELNSLVLAAQTAANSKTYMPRICYVVAHKNHSTRLYVADEQRGCGRNLNVPAGTIADKQIIPSNRFEFVLASAGGLQVREGTQICTRECIVCRARPSRPSIRLCTTQHR